MKTEAADWRFRILRTFHASIAFAIEQGAK
jgi:hypothetical protein